MKTLIRAALIGCALAVSGCATPGLTPADLVKAANDLDPDCYKDVQLQVTPMLLFGWAVPIISGSYRKVCHPEMAPKAGAPLQVGTVVGQ